MAHRRVPPRTIPLVGASVIASVGVGGTLVGGTVVGAGVGVGCAQAARYLALARDRPKSVDRHKEFAARNLVSYAASPGLLE